MSWCRLERISISRCLLWIILLYYSSSKANAQRRTFAPTQTLPPDLIEGLSAFNTNNGSTISPDYNMNTSDTFIPSFLTTTIPTLSPSYSSSTMAPSIMSDVSKPETEAPSMAPNTPGPTVSPTLSTESVVTGDFRQSYFGGDDLNTMTPDQVTGYQVMMKLNTKEYGIHGGEPIVKTECLVLDQISLDMVRDRRRKRRLQSSSSNSTWSIDKNLWPWDFNGKEKTSSSSLMSRKLNEEKELKVSFRMTWSSVTRNLEKKEYVFAFQRYMNSEAGVNDTLKDMTNLGIPVTRVGRVTIPIVPVTLPTAAPSLTPSSVSTTFYPTLLGGGRPAPTPTDTGKAQKIAAAITVSTVIGLGLLGFGLHRKYRARRLHRPNKKTTVYKQSSSDAISHRPDVMVDNSQRRKPGTTRRQFRPSDHSEDDIESHSNRLSPPIMDDTQSIDSDPNHAARHHGTMPVNLIPYPNNACIDQTILENCTLDDELDEYKNPSLEILRNGIESKLYPRENLIPRAFTRALLMDDDDLIVKDLDKFFGNNVGGNVQTRTSMEIEANMLCETNDWMKRKEGSSIDERQDFLQELTNKMVTTVLFDILTPEQAINILHECCAMLKLRIKEDVPQTTLIVTGLRKNVEKKDVKDAFRKFGEIDDVAVAPNSRGFGIVRYKSPKSIQKALEKFRVSEIVVQDVAVVVRRLAVSRESDAFVDVIHDDDFLMNLGIPKDLQRPRIDSGNSNFEFDDDLMMIEVPNTTGHHNYPSHGVRSLPSPPQSFDDGTGEGKKHGGTGEGYNNKSSPRHYDYNHHHNRHRRVISSPTTPTSKGMVHKKNHRRLGSESSIVSEGHKRRTQKDLKGNTSF